MGLAPFLLKAAPFMGLGLDGGVGGVVAGSGNDSNFPLSDIRLVPHYPARSPLADVLRLVAPGSDGYVTEKHAAELEALLETWSRELRSGMGHATLETMLSDSLVATSLQPVEKTEKRKDFGIDIIIYRFSPALVPGRERFLTELRGWLGAAARVETAEFLVTAIEKASGDPLSIETEIRYDLVALRRDGRREERVGLWRIGWAQNAQGAWRVERWEATAETVSASGGPVFGDVTSRALGGAESYSKQLMRGADYWRTVLDGACGIDVYGNNGVAAGDYDNDGLDDLYVCQPAGLPNRLYRNRGDGTFEDVTDKAGVGVLDNTSCALFADFDNRGLQDLLVVCGVGPLLFRNQGDGSFVQRKDAFQFATPPQGTFTHAAIADYDRDGRLDIYLCLYSYYLGLDQYHYPVPYFDARNGPPNFLLHNEGNGRFVDRTEAAGLNAENDRYSFACAWGDAASNGLPDLYVANDFGRANLYRNNGDGTFTAISHDAGVEQDAGAGMSACWTDTDNDGRQDIYIANMWSAAGQRVAAQKQFHEHSREEIRALYRRHARGNALYRNQGNDRFENVGERAGVEMGRWSWCSDFWDFDQDGYADLYVANGYISAPKREDGRAAQYDLGSFFWRQVVAKSPEDSTPSLAYEHGWNALNELIRSDSSWSGYERNVLFANNRDGTFSEVSGAVGLDFLEDSRSFALADLDQDGRLECVLKNRNAPQLRILHNDLREIGNSIVFRLRGTKSNRDAIGAAITVETGALRQTKYLQAGSGFLAQHTKEMLFGIGAAERKVKATVRWPSGLVQHFDALPVNHRIAIEEGSAAIDAKPFLAAAAAYAHPATAAKLEPLPTRVETWLINPLKAPEFSLPDARGGMFELGKTRGRFVLLCFWATTAQESMQQLHMLEQHRQEWMAQQLNGVAVNVDEEDARAAAREFARKEKFSFPVVFATQEVAGIYNILYRYLFDRRRDLAIPAGLLLDGDGMIIKVYQGLVEPKRVVEDLRTRPTTAAERMQRALPLGGVLYDSAFVRNDFTYGVALFQHGYLEQAAESFEQVIAAKPNNAEGYYNLGTLNLRRNDLEAARKYLEQTVKLRPNYPEAWNNLGMIAAQQGRAAEAVEHFQHSLEQRPEYAIALLNLGNVYRRQGAFGKAEEMLNRALGLQPDDAEIHFSLGMMYAQQGEMGRAAESLQKAIALRPDYAEALNNLGILYVRSQQYAKAVEQFSTCIRVAPQFDQAYINLARVYAIEGDRQRAREVLQTLLELQPQNAAAQKTLDLLK